jgi:prepilin peptidase CpaA
MALLADIVLLAALAAFVVSMLYGAASDLARFEIPNWTSLVGAGAFIPAVVAAGHAPEALLTALAVGLGCLVIGIVLFALGLFGGGDVKLLAAGAVWAGWDGLFAYLFLVAVVGGVLSLALLVFRRLPLAGRLRLVRWVERLHAREAGVPYGIAIAAGALLVLPHLALLGG